MKNIILYTLLVLFCLTVYSVYADDFSQALKTCKNYSENGFARYNNQIFDISITLEKSKNNCVYKEKIHQGSSYQMLTCKFKQEDLPFLSSSMQKFNEIYKNEISKNSIFGAKMTGNEDIFERYLLDPKYCAITHSTRK